MIPGEQPFTSTPRAYLSWGFICSLRFWVNLIGTGIRDFDARRHSCLRDISDNGSWRQTGCLVIDLCLPRGIVKMGECLASGADESTSQGEYNPRIENSKKWNLWHPQKLSPKSVCPSLFSQAKLLPPVLLEPSRETDAKSQFFTAKYAHKKTQSKEMWRPQQEVSETYPQPKIFTVFAAIHKTVWLSPLSLKSPVCREIFSLLRFKAGFSIGCLVRVSLVSWKWCLVCVCFFWGMRLCFILKV